MGILAASIIHFPATERGASATFHNHANDVSNLGVVMQGAYGDSSLTYHTQSSAPFPAKTGSLAITNKQSYFNILRYSTIEYAFGIITEDTFKEVIVWNSTLEDNWFGDVNITGVSLPTDTSLNTIVPDTPPYLLAHLGEYVYHVEATADGSPTVDDALVLQYDTKDNISLPVTGLRVVLFSYSPNWGEGVEQTYSYNTDILPAKDGTEQRIKLREFPRMSLKYDFLVEDEEARILSNNMIGWGDKPFAVPLWMECLGTNGISASGQAIINISETTGTAGGYSDLYYVPHTGQIHEAASHVVSTSPNAETIQDTFVAAQLINETRSYHINEVNMLVISVTATLDSLSTVTITADDTDVVVLANETVDATTEYFIRGNNVHVRVTTGAQDPPTDIVVDVRDNAEETEVTLSVNLEVEIPDGSLIYPCVLGFITSINEYKAHHDSLKGISVTIGSDTLPYLPELITAPQHNGSLVENNNPDWKDGQKQDLARTLFLQDYKYGILGFGRTKDFIGGKLGRNDTLWDARNIKQFKEEMQRRAGRLRPYWLPTFTTDIIINTAGVFDQTFILIDDNDNDLIFARTRDYRHIRLVFNDGTILYREILSMVFSGSDLQLNLDSALGVAFVPSDFKIVNYMSFVRGDFDSVAFKWEHRKLVTIQQSFRGVIQ